MEKEHIKPTLTVMCHSRHFYLGIHNVSHGIASAIIKSAPLAEQLKGQVKRELQVPPFVHMGGIRGQEVTY
jgi:hypothetical protein